MERTRAFVSLIRPVNSVLVGLAVVIGGVLSGLKYWNAPWLSLAFGFLTGFLLTAGSMVINDYYDWEIDSVNEPKRAIPSGRVKPDEAFGLALVLAAAGFLAAYVTGTLCLLAAVIAWLVSVAYTTRGKRSGLPGNFLVSTCVAIPFIYGSMAVKGSVEPGVLVFALIAFLSCTGREITKGIVDVEGDRSMNIRTLAVRYGGKVAAITAVIFYLSAVVLSSAPWLIRIVSVWFVPLVVVTDSGLTACSLMLLRDYSRENARRVKNRVLVFFVLGLLAFVAGAYG
jgi:geranylgeranylglycerol-phosphate geranylgeranyltransferase